MERKKILVVDDEEDLCEILRFNLESEGFQVETARSAEEALQFPCASYDLILLDIMMEGMSGLKMAEKLRKDKKCEVPIIFLTAKDSENDMLTGFSLGADDYISKPFSIKEVTARVRAVLKRAAAISEALPDKLIEAGELQINQTTKQVSIGGKAVALTKKEFEILTLLARSPHRVFSREDFLDRIWMDEGYVLERTIDVHITRLRKKLGESGRHIVNRAGYGYCFEP